MPPEKVIIYSLIASALSAFAALITAVASLLMARSYMHTYKAQFFLEFTERYNTKEMNDAIYRLVKQYKDEGAGDAFIENWIASYRRGESDAIALEYDRRVVNRYFVNIAQLFEKKFIAKSFAQLISNFYGLNVFYLIILPMNLALYGPSKPTYAETLRKIRKHFGDGEL